MNSDFTWVPIYNKIAYKLLDFKNNRTALVNLMYEILEELNLFNEKDEKNCNLDKYKGVRCKYDDIDPFSFMNRLALYNFDNRKNIIRKFQEKTGMKIEIPEDFDGVPSVNAQKSCMIEFKDDRKPNDINEFWDFFETALKYSETQTKELEDQFIIYYDKLLDKPNCKFNVSICLFRMNANYYLNLDSTNREFLYQKFGLKIDYCPNGSAYLILMRKIKEIINNSLEFDSLVDFSNKANVIREKNPKKMETKKYWLYSPGENAIYWNDCLKNNIMVIGWDNLGDLYNYKNDDEIYNSIKENYQKENPMNDNCACIDFLRNMNIGDIVIAKTGAKTLLGYGVVESDYYFDSNREKFKHTRRVKWIKKGKWTNSIVRNVLKTLTDITQYSGYPEQLMNIIDNNIINTNNINYFWLNANQKIWSFSDIKVGDIVEYTAINEIGNKRRIYQNFIDAKKGDLVIGYESSPIKCIVALLIVEEELNNNIIKFKKIEQLINPISFKEIKEQKELQNMEFIKNGQGSLFRLEKEEYEIIIDMLRDLNPKTINKYEDYDKEKFFNDVYIDEQKYYEIENLLKRKKNIILQGAPGVGKTYMAKRLAYSLMEEKNNDRIEFVQFHQSYSYEDFIEGYRPTEDGNFELTKGVFYNFCKKAENDSENKPYYLIIDEINRGNLSKIFGELLMLIENDKRENTILTLAYSKVKFTVPKNLYIIGMMNTADRSLAIIDYALRRRFSFVDIIPAFENSTFKRYQKSVNNKYLNKVIDNIKILNKEIKNDQSLGEGFVIGHSYFCDLKNNCSTAEIKSIITYDIIPMLKEYWFDEENKVEEWKAKLLED